jgi:hypothetical protein
MDQIGGDVTGLVLESVGAAVPVVEAVEFAEASAAGGDAIAVLIDPVEIVVDGYKGIRGAGRGRRVHAATSERDQSKDCER